MDRKKPRKHIVLTSHPTAQKPAPPIHWGAPNARQRGPIIASVADPSHRNAIGTHSGSYGLYRALAIAAGSLDPEHKPDFSHTDPACTIGPFPSWNSAQTIVSLDPYGAMVGECFKRELQEGFDIRPTIAITKARIQLPELQEAIARGRLHPDNQLLYPDGSCNVTKASIEPVWYLPGLAERINIAEVKLRHMLFEHTAGMYPELVTRPDLKVFLPPIGGHTVYIFGDVQAITDKQKRISCRVHDECNGSDVFGSDICTCRPYLIYGIERCIEEGLGGGAGIIVYNRKEGRALGEVTKFLVYNARKRQVGGDTADAYFSRTECVAGVQDMRFQELMPDVLHWLGIRTIHRFVSMSNLKYDAIVKSGIRIVERVTIPEELIPEDAQVEIKAKQAAGYYSETELPTEGGLKQIKGRTLESL